MEGDFKMGVKLCGCGQNIAMHMSACNKCQIEQLQAEKERLKAELSGWREHEDEIKAKMQRFDGLQAEALQLRELVGTWKVRAERMNSELQVGRDGADDGSISHGKMDMLEECIDEVEETLTTTPRTEALARLLSAINSVFMFYSDQGHWSNELLLIAQSRLREHQEVK